MAKPLAELIFSDVPGYQRGDFDTICPKTGRICPEKASLVSQYSGDVTAESDFDRANDDREILVIKLGEYGFQSIGVDCDARATETFCPTRQKMNDNSARKVGVNGIRNVMSMLGIRGHKLNG